jgi:hypothetical protein
LFGTNKTFAMIVPNETKGLRMDEVIQLIRQAKGVLERAERIVLEQSQPAQAATAQTGTGYDNPQSPQSWLRFFRFLRAVQKEGNAGIDINRQRELAIAVGYKDARATGGFFNGSGASMTRDPATDQRYLTDVGTSFIQQGYARFGIAIDELPKPLSESD